MDSGIGMSFEFNGYYTRLLTIKDEHELQLLCHRCRDYFNVVEGRAAGENAAREILEELPPGKNSEDKFVLGVFNRCNELAGVLDLVRDYPYEKEWIIGLLLLDPEERGKNLGQKLHHYVVECALRSNAEKLRIGVVEDNRKAYDFWTKLGYRELERKNIHYGEKDNVVIVMGYKL